MQWRTRLHDAAPALEAPRALMLSRRTFLTAAAVAGSACKQRATGFPGYVFVANAGERSVAAVDLNRFAVARQIQLENAPGLVLAHPAKRLVYVLSPGTAAVHEIGAEALAVRHKLVLGGTAPAMRFSPDGRSLWIACRRPHALVKLALDPLAIAGRIKLPSAPEDFDLSQYRDIAAVVLPEHNSIAMVDLAGMTVERVVPAGEHPLMARFRSDGRQMLVANQGQRTLTILDVASGGTLVRLPLPVEPRHLCFKADGGELFVSGPGMDAVVVVRPYETEVAETKLAGKAPGAMAISPKPEYLFVANPESGDVTVLEVDTRNVIAAVSVGQEPSFITFTPDNQYALVLNHRSGDLAVIRINGITQNRSKTAPLFTMIPVGSGPVSAAVEQV